MSVPTCAVEMHMDMSQEQLIWKFTAVRFDRDTCFVRACASLNAHGHVTRVILCGNLQGIYSCTLRPRHLSCERLGSRNAYGHFTRAILCGNSRGKLPYASTATLVSREHAQSKCTWTWKFIGKMPSAPDTTPIKLTGPQDLP